MGFCFDELIEDEKFGYIFKNDKEFFENNLKNKDYWDNGEQRGKNRCFQFCLLPQPVTGDINNAKIFLLNENPSFVIKDYEEEKELKPYLIDALKMDYSGCLKDYPFYCLNPKLSHTGAAEWWTGRGHFNSYLKAGYKAEDLAKKFCCIELIPYHARKLPLTTQKMSECPSTKRMREYVEKTLLLRAQRKEIVIICLRSIEAWGISEDNDNNVYMTSNYQIANFGLKGKYNSVVKEFLNL